MTKKQEPNSKVKSYRISQKDSDILKLKKINVSEIIKEAIRKAVDENICPTCGQELHKSKS